MKRYKQFEKFSEFYLLEYIIKPEEYINSIEDKINSSYRKAFTKDRELGRICRELTNIFTSNRIVFIPEKTIALGNEEFTFYGINKGSTLPDKKGTIGIFCNYNILDCVNNRNFFNGFKKWFLFVCKHELVHRGQALQIEDAKLRASVLKKDFDDQIQYLSDKQEIMARAWEIVELFRFQNYSDKQILNLLKKDSIEKFQVRTLKVYHEYFDMSDSVMKLLYKYMYWYL